MKPIQAVIYGGDLEDALVTSLVAACEQEGVALERRPGQPDADALMRAGSPAPGLIILPAGEEDCLGVKQAQQIRLASPFHVVALVDRALPSPAYLCLAFREGVDDVIALSGEKESLRSRIARLVKRLECNSRQAADAERRRGEQEALHRLRAQCEARIARWKERMLFLAATASRIASGELQMDNLSPLLVVAVSSASQAGSAADLARKMGFMVEVAHDGASALAAMARNAPAVLLSDGTLPDMDAVELAGRTRQTLAARPVVIIAWSSNADLEETLMAPGTGIDDFVLKSAAREGMGMLAAALLGAIR